MRSVTTRFERVPLAATKSVPCTVCGKKVRRQRTFEQTRSPFNLTASGEIKGYGDIYRELGEQAEAWKAEPEVHTKCVGEAS